MLLSVKREEVCSRILFFCFYVRSSLYFEDLMVSQVSFFHMGLTTPYFIKEITYVSGRHMPDRSTRWVREILYKGKDQIA